MKTIRSLVALLPLVLVAPLGCGSSSGAATNPGAGGGGAAGGGAAGAGGADGGGSGSDGAAGTDAAAEAGPDAAGEAGGDAGGAHAIRTVFLIVMENHDWSQIVGSASAPYLNGLLKQASYATKYYNPPGLHPSEPNYIWLEAGTNLGITNDSGPSANHQSTTAHLARLLDDAGVSWRSYQEDISGKVCPLTSVGKYAPRHNPFVFFDDMTGNLDPNDAACIAHNRPYSELAADLAANKVARYNFLTPNLCHDMHDSCAPTSNPIKQGDSWLAAELPKLMASDAYKDGGAIFVTWDEGAGSDGPIGMIVLSPVAKGGGYTSATKYTHSSTLRTMQEIFGVTPLLADAANATDLSDLFTSFP